MFRNRATTLAAGTFAALALVVGAAGVSAAQPAAAVKGVAYESGFAAAATLASYPVAPGYRVNVRSGPGTQYAIVKVLPLGAYVSIHCQMYGETVTGPYGTSNIWDNIGSGQFVADAYVKTGSDSFVAPRCA